jgi:endonuclease/exonuclease/phosphatase family metal-dependent hydrolase
MFVSSAHAFDFKVLSWNVFMLPKPIKHSLQNTRTKELPLALKKLPHDLIFMQEAFMKKFRKSVKAALKSSHPHTYYLPSPSIPYPVMGSGLFVLSRYPAKLIDRVYFNKCTSADCLAAKGAFMMEVTLPNGEEIQVVNTHLQAMRGNGSIRMKQLGQIHAMLVKNSKPEVPQFLVGDLNIDFNEPEFMMGLNLLGMEFSQLTGPIAFTSGRTNDCYKVDGDQQWIDHMWFGNSRIPASEVNVKVMDFPYQGKNCPLSDHHAVEALFHI